MQLGYSNTDMISYTENVSIEELTEKECEFIVGGGFWSTLGKIAVGIGKGILLAGAELAEALLISSAQPDFGPPLPPPWPR